MDKICSGFGNRNIFVDITKCLNEAICYAIEEGCNVFYTGAMGEFDKLFSSAVREAKRKNPNIKLICVKPYMTKEINESLVYKSNLYFDDLIVPEELAGIHYKAAIGKRNEWMIDHSDIVLVYTIRNYGGANTAKNFALKKGKVVIDL
ncbi:MAG: DUF1273 domain-containing protein [Ruminococcus sp.]